MWLYNNEPFDESLADTYVGFVYLITNQTTGMKYIGKKRFKRVHTYQLKKKKKRRMVESDWKDYTGSNAQLNEHVQSDHILVKEILHLCSSLGWCSYYETLEILQREALQREDFYNLWTSCKIHRRHLK